MLATLTLLLVALAVPQWAPVLLQGLGDFLVIRDPLEPADAVIAVSGDGTGERARAAAALIRAGYAPWLILSGSTAGHARGGATAAMVRQARAAGVPEERILVDEASSTTGDNARHSAALMADHGLRRAILVTSPYHTRRAAWIFRAEFRPRGLEVRVLAAADSFFQVERWWTRRRDRNLVLREYVKLLGVLVGQR